MEPLEPGLQAPRLGGAPRILIPPLKKRKKKRKKKKEKEKKKKIREKRNKGNLTKNSS